jgi:hypothetical protein
MMASLKRYKRKFMVLVLLFLVCLVWSFVNYFVHASRLTTASDSFTIRQPEAKVIQLRGCIHNAKRNSSTDMDMTTGSIDSLNAANVAMSAMLKGINRTLIKFINNFHASKISENPVATLRESQPQNRRLT